MLDTFNDRQTAYKFAVSASGVRADARMLDDGRNRDFSYDGVWTAATAITDSGYVVEMEIPYRTIKHDGTSGGWGLDFDRWVSQTKEDLYWSAYEQNEGMRISKFGRLRVRRGPALRRRPEPGAVPSRHRADDLQRIRATTPTRTSGSTSSITPPSSSRFC